MTRFLFKWVGGWGGYFNCIIEAVIVLGIKTYQKKKTPEILHYELRSSFFYLCMLKNYMHGYIALYIQLFH